MLYPKNLEEKIGFDKIRNLLKNNCSGGLGIARVDQIRFTSDAERLQKSLSQTHELKRILEKRESSLIGEYYDFTGSLTKAEKINAYLPEEEFHQIRQTLDQTDQLLKFLSRHKVEYPELALLVIGCYLHPDLLGELNRVLDEQGKIRNNASKELLEIREELSGNHLRVRKILDRIMNRFIQEGYSSEDASITIRNGRLVIPVRSDFKRKVGGFIHDESASGQTAFIEPASALEINNDILELEYREKREIQKILTRLTDLIRPEINNLRKCLDLLGIIDFIRAKAKLALTMEAVLPDVDNKPLIKLYAARHPLLYLAHKKQKKQVVPLDIKLEKNCRILIISGPNAGGKSVCLKTVAIIQYMFQCGLLVPVGEGSVLGIFNGMHIDIGDEQSIENDLSTYSSHLINMKFFLTHTSPRTLFLIDEFGTGTEPQFGGAIAEALLDHFRESGAYGIITTHYTNLKKYAEDHAGVSNGAMRFDMLKMEPLFILDIGRPGSSFAIEIARNIGLPEKILNDARKIVGFDQVNYERLLGELESEKIRLAEQIRKFEKKELELKKLVEEYESIKEYIDNNKNQILNEAKAQARELLNETNKTIESTIREIKEAQAEKTRTKIAREKIDSFREKITIRVKPTYGSFEKKIAGGKIQAGCWVRLRGQNETGQVIGVTGKEAEVIVGNIKIKIALSKLEMVQGASSSAKSDQTYSLRSSDFFLGEDVLNFYPELDIRGKRGNEIPVILDQFLDKALLLSIHELRIIHGKGDGILRTLVREHLKKFDFIENFTDEHADRGGSGITVIQLK